MLAYYAKRSPGEDFERISAPLKEAGVWVDGSNLSDSEIDSLITKFELDPNIVYDVRDRGELPRVEYSDTVAYVCSCACRALLRPATYRRSRCCAC